MRIVKNPKGNRMEIVEIRRRSPGAPYWKHSLYSNMGALPSPFWAKHSEVEESAFLQFVAKA
jgi:hypothetical protein